MYDIVIIGAGPSGSMLAKLIGERYKVLIIDKRDFLDTGNNKINKCCGGLLAPDAQNIIAKLGLGIPKEILVDPQLFAVRTIDMNNNIERLYQRFYFNMNREKFDKWLVSMIPKDVNKQFNSVFKGFKKNTEGYIVKYVKDGKTVEVKSKVLIGADGANSKVRRMSFPKKVSPKTYISIQEWYEATDYMPYFTAIFDEDLSDFYSWIIPKNNSILLGGAFNVGNQSIEKFEKLKKKLSDRGFSFGNKIKTEGAYIYRPVNTRQLFTGEGNIALIGEASGAISPSSAEGFSYGLKSALYLSQSLNQGIHGFNTRYSHKMKSLKLNVFLKNLKSPAMYNPFLRKLAMKSGLQSIHYDKND
ncbi:FAD-binding protein [Sporosalibacterium faouarense]|uniref:FAD-binding protein n=1 Tax=Sporosalibacterium faouarense TaxID=516123 RepID=UPI00141C4DA6|nr:FAD-binding protein [Sporosalibacterium faouarense]MTI47044.1 FAD-binding protein [Bacillota bacterium]